MPPIAFSIPVSLSLSQLHWVTTNGHFITPPPSYIATNPLPPPALPLDLSAYNIFNMKSLGGRLLCLLAILWLIVVSHLPAPLTRPSCHAPVSRQPFRAGNKLRHLIASAHLVIKTTGFKLGQRSEEFKRKRSSCRKKKDGERKGEKERGGCQGSLSAKWIVLFSIPCSAAAANFVCRRIRNSNQNFIQMRHKTHYTRASLYI